MNFDERYVSLYHSFKFSKDFKYFKIKYNLGKKAIQKKKKRKKRDAAFACKAILMLWRTQWSDMHQMNSVHT